MSIVIVSIKEWHRRFVDEIAERTGEKVIFISEKKLVTVENLHDLQSRLIFFPHWSFMIPAEIYENFSCIVFHMTDLPFGRGGSPLQNLISRGIYETKISAIRCTATLDGGEIYMKRPLSLWGTAEEIFLRGAEITKEMMIELIREDIKPTPQDGVPVVFKRRTPRESDISSLESLSKVFDYIRMLDADGYPAAFLETEHLRLEFSRASLKEDEILADVRIKNKKGEEDVQKSSGSSCSS